MSPAPATGPLNTRDSVATELRTLGLRPGESVLVHSSLSALGWVCGGASAVVAALLDVLGPRGTLVVPTHTAENSDPAGWVNPPVPREWWPVIRAETPAYDPATTRSFHVGVVPETVRTWPGAARSAHPQTSFAAVGPRAQAIVADHAPDCRMGERSPLAHLEAAGARVLLLGVGYDSCSAFHLAEYRIPGPRGDNSFAAMTPAGRRWITVRDVEVDDDRFDELGAAFEREHPVARGTVGAADARLFALPDAVAYAEGWLARHRPYAATAER
ncbi:aminoglycoside N(3)-acetyltransferase [Streptomyces sp. NPDC057702]|uniref:aminoglycoside N(3)-acetyltransferase n=1 Tax=unclassified Streptomyces TaxID=2593676 RepID=UPI0036BFF91A